MGSNIPQRRRRSSSSSSRRSRQDPSSFWLDCIDRLRSKWCDNGCCDHPRRINNDDASSTRTTTTTTAATATTTAAAAAGGMTTTTTTTTTRNSGGSARATDKGNADGRDKCDDSEEDEGGGAKDREDANGAPVADAVVEATRDYAPKGLEQPFRDLFRALQPCLYPGMPVARGLGEGGDGGGGGGTRVTAATAAAATAATTPTPTTNACVFIQGPRGCGKSVLLQQCLRAIKEHGRRHDDAPAERRDDNRSRGKDDQNMPVAVEPANHTAASYRTVHLPGSLLTRDIQEVLREISRQLLLHGRQNSGGGGGGDGSGGTTAKKAAANENSDERNYDATHGRAPDAEEEDGDGEDDDETTTHAETAHGDGGTDADERDEDVDAPLRKKQRWTTQDLFHTRLLNEVLRDANIDGLPVLFILDDLDVLISTSSASSAAASSSSTAMGGGGNPQLLLYHLLDRVASDTSYLAVVGLTSQQCVLQQLEKRIASRAHGTAVFVQLGATPAALACWSEASLLATANDRNSNNHASPMDRLADTILDVFAKEITSPSSLAGRVGVRTATNREDATTASKQSWIEKSEAEQQQLEQLEQRHVEQQIIYESLYNDLARIFKRKQRRTVAAAPPTDGPSDRGGGREAKDSSSSKDGADDEGGGGAPTPDDDEDEDEVLYRLMQRQLYTGKTMRWFSRVVFTALSLLREDVRRRGRRQSRRGQGSAATAAATTTSANGDGDDGIHAPLHLEARHLLEAFAIMGVPAVPVQGSTRKNQKLSELDILTKLDPPVQTLRNLSGPQMTVVLACRRLLVREGQRTAKATGGSVHAAPLTFERILQEYKLCRAHSLYSTTTLRRAFLDLLRCSVLRPASDHTGTGPLQYYHMNQNQVLRIDHPHSVLDWKTLSKIPLQLTVDVYRHVQWTLQHHPNMLDLPTALLEWGKQNH